MLTLIKNRSVLVNIYALGVKPLPILLWKDVMFRCFGESIPNTNSPLTQDSRIGNTLGTEFLWDSR